MDVRDPGFLDHLRGLRPGTAVVVAFGQIFPKTLLELPVHGCINVHASLLRHGIEARHRFRPPSSPGIG